MWDSKTQLLKAKTKLVGTKIFKIWKKQHPKMAYQREKKQQITKHTIVKAKQCLPQRRVNNIPKSVVHDWVLMMVQSRRPYKLLKRQYYLRPRIQKNNVPKSDLTALSYMILVNRIIQYANDVDTTVSLGTIPSIYTAQSTVSMKMRSSIEKKSMVRHIWHSTYKPPIR